MREESPVTRPWAGTREQSRRTDEAWDGRSPIVLVALDGSSEAKVALAAARLISQVVGATIHIVHVTSPTVSHVELISRLRLSPDEVRGVVFEHTARPTADGIVRVAETRRAMLIAMATRSGSASLGRAIRPVVERTLYLAPCPVLLVRPELVDWVRTRSRIERMLLPLDGAPSTAAVVGPAAHLASRGGAEVDLLYVATRAPRPQERGTLTTPQYVDQPQHEWWSWAQEFISRFFVSACVDCEPPGLHVFLRRGDPATEVLRLAADRQSDLIVLEWRGRLDPTHARVVRAVVASAPCPVLLLRTSDRGPAFLSA